MPAAGRCLRTLPHFTLNATASTKYVQATLNWDTRRAVTARELAFDPKGATKIVFAPVALAAQTTDGEN